MHIVYVVHHRFPTEKAHGFQVAQVCAALAELGHRVSVITPTIGAPMQRSASDYYGLPESFTVQALPQFDALASPLVPGALAFWCMMRSYRRQVLRWLPSVEADLYYTRSAQVASWLVRAGRPVVLELHTLPRGLGRAFHALCLQCRTVVCLTTPMRDALLAAGIPARCLTVAADGVRMERFAALPSMASARQSWGLPPSVPIIGYCGSLVTHDTLEKGVDVLIRALAHRVARGAPAALGWIVGGPQMWVDRYRALAQSLGLREADIAFAGAIEPVRVPSALAACSVLVYPAPAEQHPFFVRDTSPLKLTEYLAAGRPVLCADLPPVHDIVDASCAQFCPPGDALALSQAIDALLEDAPRAAALVQAGAERLHALSWTARMGRILQAAGY